MSRVLSVVLCVVIAGWVGREITWSESWQNQCPLRFEQQLSKARASVSAQSDGVEDNALMNELTTKATALMTEGKCVETSMLIKQLEIDKCDCGLLVADGDGERVTEANRRDNIDFEKLRSSVVVVAGIYKCGRCDNWHAAPASGFIVSEDGAIMTSYHVVNDTAQKTFVVMTSDGEVYPVTRVLAASKDNDLALLKIEAQGLLPLTLGPVPAIGESIGVLSHPATHFFLYSSGVVARRVKLRITERVVDGVQITADFARGSSGGPVVNTKGQVIGVVRSTESIFADHEGRQPHDFQMVVKTCIPATAIKGLTSQ